MILKTAFLDTNVVDKCIERKLNGHVLKDKLTKMNLIPVIGPFVIYEHAKMHENKPQMMQANFSFINELKPLITAPRTILYSLEHQHIKGGTPLSIIAIIYGSYKLNEKIHSLSKGIVDEEVIYLVTEHKKSLKNALTQWTPKNSKELYREKYQTVESRIQYATEQLKINHEFRQEFKANISNLLPEISDEELLKLIHKMNDYPALRTLLHQQLYLEFTTEWHGTTPGKNRFSDGIQMIEAAYCDTFITDDNDLLKHGAKINQYIEMMSIYDII